MNFGLWAWVAFAVLVVAPFVTMGLGWRFGLLEGEHRGRCSERERQLERERRKALRDAGPPPDIRAKTGPLPAIWELPGGLRPVHPRRPPDHITAVDLAPVTVPGRPQPVTHPGPDTRALHPLTDTGEIRAAGDAWIKNMRDKGMIS